MHPLTDPTSPKFGHCTADDYAATQEARGLESFRLLFWCLVLVLLAWFNLSPLLPAPPAAKETAAVGVYRPYGVTNQE
jgi:hypothetical protein